MAKQISSELVEYMADLVWNRLLDTFGDEFSDAIYTVKEDPDLQDEINYLDDEEDGLHELSGRVKKEIGRTFLNY